MDEYPCVLAERPVDSCEKVRGQDAGGPPTPDVQGNPGGPVFSDPLPPLLDILWLGHRGKPRQPRYLSICPPEASFTFQTVWWL